MTATLPPPPSEAPTERMEKAPPFEPFPKLSRLSRDCVITEKIDGTNAQVYVSPDGTVRAGSRNRWITPEADNFGFAKWVQENREELLKLGPGRHYGEWWGLGIQRGYGLFERRFSLFNVQKWTKDNIPKCCSLVPVLYRGVFHCDAVEVIMSHLRLKGSLAVLGWMKPEGIVVYHSAAKVGFKKTLENDESPKSMAKEIQ